MRREGTNKRKEVQRIVIAYSGSDSNIRTKEKKGEGGEGEGVELE